MKQKKAQALFRITQSGRITERIELKGYDCGVPGLTVMRAHQWQGKGLQPVPLEHWTLIHDDSGKVVFSFPVNLKIKQVEQAIERWKAGGMIDWTDEPSWQSHGVVSVRELHMRVYGL